MNNFMEGTVLFFKSADGWKPWLAEQQNSVQVVWLQIAKKGANLTTVTYDEADGGMSQL